MAQTNAKKPAAKKRKKKKGWGRLILTILMVVLILVASAFIYYLGRTIYNTYLHGESSGSGTEVDPITYETTPVAQSTKVGYYLVGLMGENGVESPTELLSLCCFDKQQNTLRVLQVPQATYLGTDSAFKVRQIAQVFPQPQDFVWCETCRCRVFEPERTEDGHHSVCNTELTTKEGSATVNLAEVFNRQYGLPVDGYYIFEQDTFRKLVDLIGGVEVELAFDMKVSGTTYQKGVRLIDGVTALQYIAASGTGIDKDIERMSRFQQVCTAVLQRLFAMSDEKMTEDVFQPLMAGSTPIRVAVNDNYKNIVELVRKLSKVKFDDMITYVIPGEQSKSDGTVYYSVHRQELLALLNAQFAPYGDKLAEGDLAITELAVTGQADLHEAPLSQWVVEQSHVVTTTAAEETTSTTAAG